MTAKRKLLPVKGLVVVGMVSTASAFITCYYENTGVFCAPADQRVGWISPCPSTQPQGAYILTDGAWYTGHGIVTNPPGPIPQSYIAHAKALLPNTVPCRGPAYFINPCDNQRNTITTWEDQYGNYHYNTVDTTQTCPY